MKKKRKVSLILILTAFIILSIPRLRTLISAYRKLNYYQKRIAVLEKENSMLKNKIDNIKDDPYYTEKILRENFGLIKKGEVVYRIGD